MLGIQTLAQDMTLQISHFGVDSTLIGSKEDSSQGLTHITLGAQTFAQAWLLHMLGHTFWIVL